MSLEVSSVSVTVREGGACTTTVFTVLHSAGYVVTVFDSATGALPTRHHRIWEHVPYQLPPRGDSR